LGTLWLKKNEIYSLTKKWFKNQRMRVISLDKFVLTMSKRFIQLDH